MRKSYRNECSFLVSSRHTIRRHGLGCFGFVIAKSIGGHQTGSKGQTSIKSEVVACNRRGASSNDGSATSYIDS
jgi:hypothetical protein